MAKSKTKTPDPTDDFDDYRRGLTVHCGACDYEWHLCIRPIPLKDLARFRDIPCPKCFAGPIIVGDSKASRERHAKWMRERGAEIAAATAEKAKQAGPSEPGAPATGGSA